VVGTLRVGDRGKVAFDVTANPAW